jgi:sulfoxide reductase heme-binding subunit YedZ
MTERARNGPPLARHVAAVGVIALLMLAFSWPYGREALPLTHAVLADTSLALLCLILTLGALARLVPRLRPAVPWGRELGIGMFVTAGLHVAILLDPEFLDLIPSVDEADRSMWTAAWWIGLVALGYALVLAATSNDWSQRTLGRGWKFLQRQAYTLFVLTWLHTAAYVLLGAGHGASLGVWLLWGLTAVVVTAQLAGFVHTVRASRGPSPHRVPSKADSPGSLVLGSGTARWFGVAALWACLIAGTWILAHVESVEERQVSVLCERYDQLRGSPIAEIRDELMEVAPEDAGPGAPLSEWLERCDDN